MQQGIFSASQSPCVGWQAHLRMASSATLSLLLLTTPMTSQATQEPDYQVLQKEEAMEVRAYSGYSVAEVLVPGPAQSAGSAAFPILAGYIFGKNKGERKLAMTAPVTQTAAPVKLEMTAPVMQSQAATGFWVQFVLPQGVTSANAPEPQDPRVQLRDIAPQRIAVIRYSGFWSESNDDSHLSLLQTAMKNANLKAVGEPVYARYNPPFTPWFLRRNEIWLHLATAP